MSTEILAAAIEYTKRGWPIHPLSGPNDEGASPGKKPILNNWQNFTKTPDDIGAYIKNGCNIGLVCGKTSKVDALDNDLDLFLDELMQGVTINTLMSGHREGRGHILFQHEEDLFSEKHHFIGLEYFGNNEKGAGSNLVLPPSVHHSGEVYKWKDANAPLMRMPGRLKENWKRLAKRENDLHDYFKKCRRCFTIGSKKYDKEDVRSKGLWDRPDDIAVHGMEGRRAILAIAGELKAVGCTDDLLHMACKRFFGKDYKYEQTADALKHIESIHPKCETLRQYLKVECEGCSWKSAKNEELGSEKSDKKNGFEYSPENIIHHAEQQEERKLNISQLPQDHFISQYVTWGESVTDAYSEYHVGCATWLLSALARRKVVLRLRQEKLFPNLWLQLLGNSTTSRKSTAINKARTIFETVVECDLPNQDYSIEGYLESLAINSIQNNVRDESSGIMAKYHKKYNDGIFDLECALYDNQNVEKVLASGKNKTPKIFTVKNPYITKLYATTPDKLAVTMTLDDFLCGYGYRWLYSYPKYKHARKALEMETEEDTRAWVNVASRIRTLNAFFLKLDKELEFKASSEVMAHFDKYCIELEKTAEDSNNDILNSIVGRSQVHILKIAMLIELGKAQPSTTIDINSVDIAADWVINYYIPSIFETVGRLEEDVKNNKIEKIISIMRRRGGEVSHTRLLQDAHLVSREFNECIATMIESGCITQTREKPTFYKLTTQSNPIKNSTISKISKANSIAHGDNINANSAISLRVTSASRANTLCYSANSANSANSTSLKDSNVLNESPILQKLNAASQQQKQNLDICGFCKSNLNGEREPGPLGLGACHPLCVQHHQQAISLLREKYDKPVYLNPNESDLPHLIELMDRTLANEPLEMDKEPAQIAIHAFCQIKGWRVTP